MSNLENSERYDSCPMAGHEVNLKEASLTDPDAE